jgi:cell division protein FtsI/penicillin-binding protein 2
VAGTQSTTEPVPGDTLVLSIDSHVQNVAEKALQGAIERARTMRARGSGSGSRPTPGRSW